MQDVLVLQPAALLTCHQKEAALAAPMAKAGYAVLTIDHFDTDSLGTFTGEIAREGTMLDAARAKAELACELSGERFGIGSEGSFGGDPWFGVTGWGREVLVWYDAKECFAVTAFVQGPETNYLNQSVNTLQEAIEFADKIGFPEHGVIIGEPGQPFYDKSCMDRPSFEHAVTKALMSGEVNLSTDMRAHRNPTRMKMIARCAEDLAQRLASHCSACHAPGFGAHEPVAGALCMECHRPTQQPRGVLLQCVRCGLSQEKPLRTEVPASYCDYCNP